MKKIIVIILILCSPSRANEEKCRTAIESCRRVITAHEEKDQDEMRLRVAQTRQIKEANQRTTEALNSGWSLGTVLLVGAAGLVSGAVIGVMSRGK
jgi:hypothetical protein